MFCTFTRSTWCPLSGSSSVRLELSVATTITNTTQPQPPPQKQELESDFFGEDSSFTTLLNDIHFHIFFIFYYLLHILIYYILNLFPFWSIHCWMPGTEGWKNCHQKRNAIRIPSFRHRFLFLLTSLRIGLLSSKEKDFSSTSIQWRSWWYASRYAW